MLVKGIVSFEQPGSDFPVKHKFGILDLYKRQYLDHQDTSRREFFESVL